MFKASQLKTIQSVLFRSRHVQQQISRPASTAAAAAVSQQREVSTKARIYMQLRFTND